MGELCRFPPEIESISLRSLQGEYAWQRQALPLLIAHCSATNMAILGGDGWLVWPLGKPIPGTAVPLGSESGTMMTRTAEHGVFGFFPLQSGQQAILAWDTNPYLSDLSWREYVEASLEKARSAIELADLENTVLAQYATSIYYNMSFRQEDGTTF